MSASKNREKSGNEEMQVHRKKRLYDNSVIAYALQKTLKLIHAVVQWVVSLNLAVPYVLGVPYVSRVQLSECISAFSSTDYPENNYRFKARKMMASQPGS